MLRAGQLLVFLGLVALGVDELQACSVPRDIEAERLQWMRIDGRYVELTYETIDKEGGPEQVWVWEGGSFAPTSETFSLKWIETLHYGQVADHLGNVFETYHVTSDLESSCPEPEGPDGNAAGIFYLSFEPASGHYVIHDWHAYSDSSETTSND